MKLISISYNPFASQYGLSENTDGFMTRDPIFFHREEMEHQVMEYLTEKDLLKRPLGLICTDDKSSAQEIKNLVAIIQKANPKAELL